MRTNVPFDLEASTTPIPTYGRSMGRGAVMVGVFPA